MPRARVIGLTDEQKDKILHCDRLSPEVRQNVAYDVRRIIEKELEDLDWYFTEAPGAFRRMRDRQFYYPFEAALPRDPRAGAQVLEKLAKWRKAIENVEAAVLGLGVKYLRTGRI